MQSRQVGDYNPVEAEGRSGDRILCFQVHGDAAFAAQVRISCFIIRVVKSYANFTVDTEHRNGIEIHFIIL